MSLTYQDIVRVNGEIKTVKIKTKSYAEVTERVKAFRKLYPEGSIQTEILSMNEDNSMVIIKATALNGDGYPLATGIAYEKEDSSFINRTSFIECCETSAVGRALGFLGLTGDSGSIASFEEMANAQMQQESIEPIDDQRLLTIKTMCAELGKDIPEDIEEWTKGKGDKAIQRLMKIRDEERSKKK